MMIARRITLAILVLAATFGFCTNAAFAGDVNQQGNFGYASTDQAGEEAAANDGSNGFYDFLCTTKCLTGDWGGHRKAWEDKGVKFSFILTMGYFTNMKGGLNTQNSDAFSGDWRMNLHLDFDKMDWIPGGFFFFRGKSSWNDGVRGHTGALSPEQWVYGSGGNEEIYVDKWWYGQKLFDDTIEFRVGKLLGPVDLFDANKYASLPWNQFSNAALNRNSAVPHRKSLGLYMRYTPCDWFEFRTAAFDADQTDGTRCADFDNALHGPARYIGFWEMNVTPKFSSANGALPGNYRLGVTYDGRVKTKYARFTRLSATDSESGDIGWYLSFDQMIWKENNKEGDKQGLGAFFRYGSADEDTNMIDKFWSIGGQYQGLIPSRDNDVLGIGFAQSRISDDYKTYVNRRADREDVYELYYAFQLTPWCVITPDLQWITNPGGLDNRDDSLVGGVRVKISF